tara:strand:+ start:235 stop:348 length:114 start_codon:yes stop_codon:yes gene_type:complete
MMAYSAEQNGRWFEGWGGRLERKIFFRGGGVKQSPGG